MYRQPAQSLSFSFLLFPDFSMMSLSAMIEPLRMANKVLGHDFYRWQVLTYDDNPVKANNGLVFTAEQRCEQLCSGELSCDYLILAAGDGVHQFYLPSVRHILKTCYRNGQYIGATSTAAFLLADANLLQNRRCTVHWEYLTAFREEFPRVTVTQSLFEIDGPLLTCSGGVSGLDMLLQVIAQQHGQTLSDKVADQYLHNNVRGVGSEQRNSLSKRYNVHHPSLLRVLALMENHIEIPLSLSELAERAHLSPRQLQRLFARDLAISVQQFYRCLRLDKACVLLRETGLSSASIGLMCGFSSSSYFSQCLRQYKGVTPRQLRAGQ